MSEDEKGGDALLRSEEAPVERELEKRKEKIFSLAKKEKKEQFLLYALLVIAAGIRLYFFNITKNQAHWWDSLAYGSLAKQAILGLWTDTAFIAHETVIRAPVLPFLWQILLRIHIPDQMAVVLLAIIPSILCVHVLYLLGKKSYSPSVGLFAAAIFAFSWTGLFYAMRVMTDILALLFALLSLYFFILSYEKFPRYTFAATIFFLFLSFLTRNQYFVYGFVYLIFLFLVQGVSFVKKKDFWLGGLIGAAPFYLYALRNKLLFDSFLPALGIYTQSAAEKASYAWYVLTNLLPHVLRLPLLLLFLLGLGIVLLETILGFDLRKRSKKIQMNLLYLLVLAASLWFFIVYLRAAEDRYLFMLFAPAFFFCSLGAIHLAKMIAGKKKEVLVAILCALLLVSFYTQFTYGSPIIEGKVGSYAQMKSAFIWMNQNLPADATLIGDGIDPYAIYYAERRVRTWNASNLVGSMEGADYAVIHAFEHQQPAVVEYVQSSPQIFTPIHATFFDASGTQPAVVIYEINKSRG